MEYARETAEIVGGYPRSVNYCLALVSIDKGMFFLVPTTCFKSRVIEFLPPAPFSIIWLGH